MTTYLWIIHTGAGGEIFQSITLKTKYKSKVGKYIRDNINDFYFMFSMFPVCSKHDSGEIVNKFNEMLDQTGYNVHDDNDTENIITEIQEIFNNYSYAGIVDNLWGASNDSEKDYANITKISPKAFIRL